MKIFGALIATCFFSAAIVQADVVLFEDFEDSTITYTTNVADDLSDIANRDYYGRIASDTATPPGSISYGNQQGTGYYGVEDTDGATSPQDILTLNWTGIDISNFENLNLSWFVAEDDDGTNEDWDETTSFLLEFQIDGGGFQNLFAIEAEADAFNVAPRVDTDFDGVGDGALITDIFTQYSSALANGSVLDIRLTIQELDAGDEDIAFDNLLLEGDFVGIPEPASCGLIALGLGLMSFRRRR